MRNMRTVSGWALFLLLLCGSPVAHSQGEKTQPDKPAAELAKSPHAYRIEFLIHELEDGKRVNVRHYSMDLNAGDHNHMKVSTRVPVFTDERHTQWNYFDVGTEIGCDLKEFGDNVSLFVTSDFSNFSTPGEQHSSQPIIRHISIAGSTVASLGKSVVIGSADDPSSNRQFQLEATVTRLK